MNNQGKNNKKPKVRLSKTSTTMFEDILENKELHHYQCVNFPLLFYGILESRDEEYETPNMLDAYFSSCEVFPNEIHANFDLIFITQDSEYAENLKAQKDSKENSIKSENDSEKESNSSYSEELITEVVFMDEKDTITDASFIDFNNKKIKFPIDGNVEKIINILNDFIKTYSITKIEPIHFAVAAFKSDIKELRDFFKDIDLNYYDAKKFFNPERIFKLNCIPFNLSSFLENFNDKIDTKKHCEILMRDKETNALWNIMLKKNKRNAVIVGEAGVGKTALVEKITYEIKAGTAPEQFKDFNVISLDVNSLLAGTRYRGDAEERISDIISFLQNNHNVILFIDEVHTILGAGSCFKGEMDLANALKPILARGDTIVIGATTQNEYEEYFQKDAALSRRFEPVEVKEPKAKDVYPMIRNKIKVLIFSIIIWLTLRLRHWRHTTYRHHSAHHTTTVHSCTGHSITHHISATSAALRHTSTNNATAISVHHLTTA